MNEFYNIYNTDEILFVPTVPGTLACLIQKRDSDMQKTREKMMLAPTTGRESGYLDKV